MPPVVTYDLDELVARARALRSATRTVIGITGPPGAGKSTLADALVAALGGDAVLVGMDGFHLAQSELVRLGRAGRKGALDTFDGYGYVALLKRLLHRDEPIVYAPRFDRAIEEPVGSAVPVPREVPIVVTEGNYLLVDAEPWSGVRPLLTASWYVEADDDLRLTRLTARHEAFGKTRDQAREWAHGSDRQNADVVVATRQLAHLVVRLPREGTGGSS